MRPRDDEAVREAVEARAREITAEVSGDGDGEPEITSDFVSKCLEQNQRGDAVLYAFLHRDRVFYEPADGTWYVWNGIHWEKDEKNKHLAWVENVAKVYLVAAEKAFQERSEMLRGGGIDKNRAQRLRGFYEACLKRAGRLRTSDYRKRVVEFAISIEDPLIVPKERLDQDPNILACANGVIDLRTGELIAPHPDQFITRAAKTEFHGLNTPCHAWKRALLEIFNGDESLVDYLQRTLGYAVAGIPKEDRFFIWVGKGRNGKSVIASTVIDVLSPHAAQIQAETLLEGVKRSASAPSPDIIRLRGLRIAFASETDEGGSFSTSKVKLLSGGDFLVGRAPHAKREVQFKPSHVLFLLTNAPPRVKFGGDLALWERVRILRFPLSFVDRPEGAPLKDDERRRNVNLKENLRKEGPGILAWLIRGYHEYKKRGLTEPEAVRQETLEYRKAQDHLGEFVDFALRHAENEALQASQLYEAFVVWWRKTRGGSRPWSSVVLGNQLLKAGFRKRKTSGRIYYLDVALTDQMKALIQEMEFRG